MKIGLLAGEASGDNLAAGLMRQVIAQAAPEEVTFVGVGGPQMCEAGLQSLATFDELAVNGFREPILRLPQLIRLFRRLVRELDRANLDAFVGVDFNVFNLLLEKSLKRRGVKTVHYVSPSVYAWRKGRTKTVADSADVLLCLYPFEPSFYAPYDVKAIFVGHPLADAIDLDAGEPRARRQARRDLGLPVDGLVLALLPGSRGSEIKLLLDDFLSAAELFAQHEGVAQLDVVIPCVNEERFQQIQTSLSTGQASDSRLNIVLHDGNARAPLVACDVALVKSGTSTLESMLLRRAMVVSYRLGAVSYQLVRRLVRTPYAALPNILHGRAIVPELMQDAATATALAENLSQELDKSRQEPEYLAQFGQMHETLKCGADERSAAAVCDLVAGRQLDAGDSTGD